MGRCILKSQLLVLLWLLLEQVVVVFVVVFLLGTTTLPFTLLLLVLQLVLLKGEQNLFDSSSSPAPKSLIPAPCSNMHFVTSAFWIGFFICNNYCSWYVCFNFTRSDVLYVCKVIVFSYPVHWLILFLLRSVCCFFQFELL